MPSRLLTPLAAGLATLLVLAGLALATTAPAQAAGANASYASSAFKASNKARAAHERKALRANACLKRFAVRQAKAMAAARSMYHQDLGPVMSTCGLRTAGENVAYGYPTGRSVVRRGWMRSAGHRANILSRSYRLMAVAARRDADGRWYAAQVFGRRL